MSRVLALILWTLPMTGFANAARPASVPSLDVVRPFRAADILAGRPGRVLFEMPEVLLDESTDDLEEDGGGDIEDLSSGFDVPLIQTLFRNGSAVEPTTLLRGLDTTSLRAPSLRC